MRSIKNFVCPHSAENGDMNDIKSRVNELASEYAGMSEDERMQTLMKYVDAAKSDGSFSPEQLDRFVRFVSPNLDDSSRDRLVRLSELIKESR